ncbi:MAG: hypothetical protein ABWY68_08730 [Cryobacterium sp.]
MDSVSARPQVHAFRTLAATVATMALVLGATVLSTAPASAAEPEDITNASFTWGMSNEAGGGAFFGGCNYLSAGTAGNTGSSRVWTEADGFYATSSTNVQVRKPNAAGTLVAPTWSTKCQTPAGTPALAAQTSSLTKNVVTLSNGTGAIAADGSTSIDWTGSFTVVFYGGMTYWTVTDPELTLDADGNGQLTGTASGYGASMEDTSKWETLAPTEIVLADITGAAITDNSFTVTPDYLGVSVTSASSPQATTGASWGSFPQSFIDFQQLTGQSSYWYSSGGSRDAAKPASPLTVSYDSATVTTPAEPADDEQVIDVTVPVVAEEPSTGSFGWSFDSTAAVSLGTAVQTGSTFTATGALNTVSVTDTRTGGSTPYSWTVSGQVSDFTSGASSFDAGYLGWTPALATPVAGVSAGSAVTSTVSGGTGLAGSATLASSSVAASASANAALALVIPDSTPAGSYSATLTVTALG